jgi:hypothetical protein
MCISCMSWMHGLAQCAGMTFLHTLLGGLALGGLVALPPSHPAGRICDKPWLLMIVCFFVRTDFLGTLQDLLTMITRMNICVAETMKRDKAAGKTSGWGGAGGGHA